MSRMNQSQIYRYIDHHPRGLFVFVGRRSWISFALRDMVATMTAWTVDIGLLAVLPRSLSLDGIAPEIDIMRWFLFRFFAYSSIVSVALAGLYDSNEYVQTYSDLSTFDNEVLRSDGISLIQFYSSSDSSSQKLVLEFSMVGKIAKGIFTVGAVDTTTEDGQALATKHGVPVKSSPTLLIFADEPEPIKYNGNNNAQAIFQNLLDAALHTFQDRAGGSANAGSQSSSSGRSNRRGGKSNVVQLTLANFQELILDSPLVSAVAFTAPWCGHCKALQPDWEEAAKKLEGEGAILGWVDATEEKELAAIYGVQGYPAIKLFHGGAGKIPSDAIEYQGGRTTEQIVQYILTEVDRSGSPKPIPELVSEDVLKENCSGHNHICVLVALPHILDSGTESRNAYKDTFAAVAKTFRGSAFSFLWFEGTAQPDLEQTLDMTFGFPAVAAFSMDKEAYVVMRTSYMEKNVAAFLHGVTSGRQRTAKVSSMPKVATTKPWDGKEGAPVEEEMPLCEVMGTCDEEDEL